MITIHGIIHPDKDPKAEEQRVSLIDVIGQAKQEPADGELVVLINSIGGSVDEGFKIHDYLRSLKRLPPLPIPINEPKKNRSEYIIFAFFCLGT
jgi:ClpP class serine protease